MKVYQIWFDMDGGELWLDSKLNPLAYLQYDEGGIYKYNYKFLFDYLQVEVVRIEPDITDKDYDWICNNQGDLNKMAKRFRKYCK